MRFSIPSIIATPPMMLPRWPAPMPPVSRLPIWLPVWLLTRLLTRLMTALLVPLLALSLALHPATAHAQARPARLPAMQTVQPSVSGLSSGAFMAVQFGVAFSATVTGVGVVAGGPYFCSQGSVFTAATSCSCSIELFTCRVRPGGTRVPDLIAITDWFAAAGTVDPPAGLARQKIWMLSGSADSVVPQAVMDDLLTYYRHYIDANHIAYKRDLAAEHAMPTDSYGNPCSVLGTPFISDCDYDAAGELLKWIYGPLTPKASAGSGPGAGPPGRLVAFNQSEFILLPGWHGMAETGYLYVPAACEANAGLGCRLHVAFHGCLQDPAHIGTLFARRAGYNAWADANRLVILYPQAAAIYPYANPNACWDWFSYDDSHYAQKAGRQMAAVKRMVDRLTGQPGQPGPTTIAPDAAPTTVRCRRDRCI